MIINGWWLIVSEFIKDQNRMLGNIRNKKTWLFQFTINQEVEWYIRKGMDFKPRLGLKSQL